MNVAPLKKLTTLVSSGSTPLGGAKVYLPKGPVMLIRSQNVLMRHLNLEDVAYITDEIASRMKRTVVQNNDVLLNITGASIGRVACIEDQDVQANVNQHVCIIRTISNLLHHRYLMHFLAQPSFQARIHSTQNGGTRQALTFEQIKQFKIPLPPIEQQKPIAAILDKANPIRRKRKEAIALTEELLRSTFLDMFGDPMINPKRWDKKPLIELIDENRPITYGILKPGENIPYVIPYVRVIDMKNGTVDVSIVRRTTKEIGNQYKRSRLHTGDLLLSIRGHVGRLAIVPEELDNANITQDTARLAVGNLLTTEYLFAFLQSHQMQHWMLNRIKGAGVKGINLADVKEIPVLIPPKPLQNKYAKFFKGIRTHQQHNRDSISYSENLFNSLLQKAFRGEL